MYAAIDVGRTGHKRGFGGMRPSVQPVLDAFLSSCLGLHNSRALQHGGNSDRQHHNGNARQPRYSTFLSAAEATNLNSPGASRHPEFQRHATLAVYSRPVAMPGLAVPVPTYFAGVEAVKHQCAPLRDNLPRASPRQIAWLRPVRPSRRKVNEH